MAATYDPTWPTPKDEARHLLGDTAVEPAEDALRSDESITAAIAARGLALGVAWLADGLVAEFSQAPVKVTLTGLAVDFSARIPTWEKLAARMRAEAAGAAAGAADAAAGSAGLETTGVW